MQLSEKKKKNANEKEKEKKRKRMSSKSMIFEIVQQNICNATIDDTKNKKRIKKKSLLSNSPHTF